MNNKTMPTLKTIAAAVGVTANTVSLALRDSPLVSPETKRRIQAAADEMGYVQNALAGSLRSGKSRTVAVVMGDIANPLFAAKIKALERVFRETGYQLMIFDSDEDPAQELSAVQAAISRKVDGVVICPCQHDDRTLNLLRQHRVPCVLMGRQFSDSPEDIVVWDDKKGGYLAARHLIECGCERIAWLGVTQRISSARDRKLGYQAALEEADRKLDPKIIVETAPTGGHVDSLVRFFLKEGVDGICAFSDLIAWEAAHCLKELGVNVPKQMKLTGFDDVQAYLKIPYGLTSISADVAAEAQEVKRLLLLRMENDNRPMTLCRMDTRLVVRESTRG